MSLAIKSEKIRQVRKKLGEFFHHMVQVYGGEDIVKELMIHRGYTSKEMFDTLMDIGVYEAPSLGDIQLLNDDYTLEFLHAIGLVTEDGDYFMTNRYVLPIKDIDGNIVALVGWDRNGGSRKYLTTTTYGFNRDTSFFNYNAAKEAWSKRNGIIIVVEGIFDSLALTSVGFPAIAVMGLEMSHLKEIMLGRFLKVIVLPDNDKGGKSVMPYTYFSVQGATYVSEKKKDQKIWKPDTETLYVSLPHGVKDSDEYVRDYAMEEDMNKLYLPSSRHYVQLL